MHIVGIGASAGGLGPLRQLLADVSPSTPAAYVVIQHLPPSQDSRLPALLQPYTQLPISTLRADVKPQQGHVYVMTGKQQVVYRQHGLRVEPRPPSSEGLSLPIDRFFDSIGQELRARAVGVVLSGTGTDGSLGTHAIKENGGLVLVQDPTTAQHDSMIEAVLGEGLADTALPPAGLARTINEVLQYRSDHTLLNLNEPRNLQFFQRALDHISDVAGIDFHRYRPPTLARRIEKRMMLDGYTDLEAYYRYLIESDEESRALFADFLIGVTRFFRNRELWTHFAETVVPALFERASSERPLRVWVPACSSGEEAYTIAILLEEWRRQHAADQSFKIFASDVDQVAIQQGSAGVYSLADVKSLPEPYLARYFDAEGEQFRIKEAIRKTVLFAVHDCLKDPPFVQLDLISCRNFLIYLRITTQRRLLDTFHFALRTGAYLLLGPSESIGTLRQVFKASHATFRVFTRMAQEDGDYRMRPQFSVPAVRLPEPAPPPPDPLATPAAADAAFVDVLLKHSVPPSIFVDTDLNVLYLQGAVADYFRFPQTKSGFALRRLVATDTGDRLYQAVRRAVRIGEEFLLPDALPHLHNDTRAGVLIRPVTLPDHDGPLVLLQVHEHTGGSLDQKQTAATTEQGTYLRTLEQSLATARRQTERLLESVESANMELETSNRELKRSNHHLQTANAELQSVNEELHMVNHELQIKNEELTIANNDIQNLLAGSKLGTLFLDSDLRIRRFTPDMRELFDLLETDIGRPIKAFAHQLEEVDLTERCRRVHETLVPFRQEVRLTNGNHYLLDILPYRTHRDVVRGLVITLFNIDSLVANRRENARLAVRFSAIFNHSSYTILFVSPTDRVTRANRPLGKYSVAELEDSPLLSLFSPAMAAELSDCLRRAFEQQTTTETLLEVPIREDQTGIFALKIIPIPFSPQGSDAEMEPSSVLIAEDIGDIYTTFLAKQEVLSAQRRIYTKYRDQIAMIDPDGRIESINYTRYTDWAPRDVAGRNIFDMIVRKDRQPFQDAVKATLAEQTPRKVSFDIQLDDTVRRVENIIAPVFTEDRVTHIALFHQGSAATEGEADRT